ncbi:DUF4124 domain-containing protein [Methylococcus sp. EFPC2]|uniref:DUF4124 domain-containing protein n=1 Tax=Methylococcus sp. EFPC2 TaxID=2812648 RepID=UPI0019679362|nr:DUF4124 domain-containing protein [Methylococcus sp. EFPC2]QSA96778.1 DUF4124 domain-containing protein [Methylococcus sp. EFPC2]
MDAAPRPCVPRSGLWALAVVMLLAGWGPVRADTYRWVDEQGKVHYSDQVPPEEAKRERARLNEQGRRVERVEAAKTPEQLAREKQLKLWRTEQTRLLTEQHDRDLALLRSFRNEEELQRALSSKLETIDAQIKVVISNRQRQEQYLQSLQQKAAGLELQGKPVNKVQRDNIEATRRQIAIHQGKIGSLENEKKLINDQFARDLQRFRNLLAQREELERSSLWHEPPPAAQDEVAAMVTCQPGAQCERVWGLAKKYVQSRTSLPLFTETDRILQTVSPRADQDIALIVVRIDGKGDNTIFLDLRCARSSLGEENCASARARAIRTDFRSALLGTM